MNIIKVTKDQLEKALGGVVKVMVDDFGRHVAIDIPAVVEIAVNEIVSAGSQIAEQLEFKFPEEKKTFEVTGQLELNF